MLDMMRPAREPAFAIYGSCFHSAPKFSTR